MYSNLPNLGHCLDLTDYGSSIILKTGYDILSYEFSALGKEMPINKNVKGNNDLLLRDMDKTHIQLCIINPNCIKGYFSPLEPNEKWSIV